MLINKVEISNLEAYILCGLVEKFCNEFIDEVKEITYTLDKLGIKGIKNILPNPFKTNKEIEIDAYYSIDKKQIFIRFNESKDRKFNFMTVYGNPIPLSMFNFEISENDTDISIFENITFQKGEAKFDIDYSFITTLAGFRKRLNNTKEFALDFINSNRDLNNYKNQNDKIKYLYYLKAVKEEFLKLISDENTPELVIDKFLELHKVILQRGLHLDKFIHQVVMKNLLDKYEHDLKPDLIAYDILNNKWVVVDYKKSKKSLIKNLDKVRTGFKADVNALENQLLDYVEYFEEKEHREYIKKEYKYNIKYPDAIGIIGTIQTEEQEAFNRLMKNKPRWFSVMPYNYLYDSFCTYINLVEEIAK